MYMTHRTVGSVVNTVYTESPTPTRHSVPWVAHSARYESSCSAVSHKPFLGVAHGRGQVPVSHLTTFCSSPRCADRVMSLGSEAGELIAARGRSEPLAPRIRVVPPASVPPLVRAAPALGAPPAESRSAKPSNKPSL